MSQEQSKLDLIITNEEGMIEDMEYLSPLGKSDHMILMFNFRTYYSHEYIEKTIGVFSYEKGNCKEIQNYLQNHEWEKDLQGKDINGQWNCISSVLQEAAAKFIPNRKVKQGGTR